MARGDFAKQIIRIKKKSPATSNGVIAKAVGCRESNVRYVLRKFLAGRSEEDLKQFQEDKPNILAAIQMRSLESITAKKLANSSAAQLSTIYGILHDKQALLLGQPTGISAVMLLDVVEAIKARDS